MCCKSPLVSVIMGVLYHRVDLEPLRYAIQSILLQSMTDFEFLICDSGSSAECVTLLEEFSATDKRIRLFHTAGKITLSEKLNVCLAEANGTYIARMDDDDFSHPERFAVQVAYLNAHPDVAFVGCNVNYVFADGSIQKKQFPRKPSPLDFRLSMPYIHPSIMFRQCGLVEAGGYSEARHCFLCEDYDLLLRMYAKGMCGVNLQEILFDYSMAGVENNRRSFHSRLNEVIVRFLRFRELHMLPGAFLYVIKPLLVGCLPLAVLNWLRHKAFER